MRKLVLFGRRFGTGEYFGNIGCSLAVFAAVMLGSLAIAPLTKGDEPGGGQAEEPEYGVFLHEGVAVKYRIVHRVLGEYTKRKTIAIEPTFGWFTMHAEYKYGAQITPMILDSWLTGIVGNMRALISCTIPEDRLKVHKRDEFELLGIPRVGDRITVKKRIRYEFAIEFRVSEGATFDIGLIEIPVFQIVTTYSKLLATGWMTQETQLWEVVEIVDPNQAPLPAPPMPAPMP